VLRCAATLLLLLAPAGAGNVPVVFNATRSARPGDLVSLQGENFGEAPEVWLGESRLPIVNSVGTGWLAVRIPKDARGALSVRIRNGDSSSAPVPLNQAWPLHLDALQIVPCGAFRIFGRNLRLPGSTPVVTVDGKAAVVDVGKSDEHLLQVTAPDGLQAGLRAAIRVDNGNGSGAAELDRTIEIVTGVTGDPFGLGVGWTAAYAPLDVRVFKPGAAADGQKDDAERIQRAIDQASAAGGGIVELPEGTWRITTPLTLKSRVVLEGAGKDKTILRYEKSNYPIWASGFDLIGLRNLTLSHAGTVEGPLIKANTRVCLQNVRFDLQVSQQLYLSENRNIVVVGCDFIQKDTVRGQGPYTFSDSAGLVFTDNTTDWKHGAPSFQESHDAYIARNTWSRDAGVQNTPIVTTHSCVLDFCHRVAVIGNTLKVVNGTLTNRDRNDGETLLTEGGGGHRTENLGAVTSASATTLTDTGNLLNVFPFKPGEIPENYGVAIVDGRGAGQTRRLIVYKDRTMTVDRPWDVVPDASSRYASFVWGLEKALLKGNTLIGNPRGIWLYQTALREVDVVGNTLREGGGIYLRMWQSVGEKQFTPHVNIRIAGNTISNTQGAWASHIGLVYVMKEPRPFGIGQIGIEVRENTLTANAKNLYLNAEDHANLEGYYMQLRAETKGKYEAPTLPCFLGAIFERNLATNCDVGYRYGTGAAGLILSGNQTVDCKQATADLPAIPGIPVSQRTRIE